MAHSVNKRSLVIYLTRFLKLEWNKSRSKVNIFLQPVARKLSAQKLECFTGEILTVLQKKISQLISGSSTGDPKSERRKSKSHPLSACSICCVYICP